MHDLGLAVARVAEIGEPAERIMAYAKGHGADVIFMPTHGRGLFCRLLLGSVLMKVLHDAPIPVWTSAHCEFSCDKFDAIPELPSVICAVDLTPDATRVIRRAAELGKALGATVRLVHAIPAPEATETSAIDGEFRRFPFEVVNDSPTRSRYILRGLYPARKSSESSKENGYLFPGRSCSDRARSAS